MKSRGSVGQKVDDLVDKFLFICQARGLSQVTVKWYQEMLKHFSQEAREISREEVWNFFNHLRDQKKHKYSEITIAMHFRALRAFCNFLVSEGYLKESPIAGIKIKSKRKETKILDLKLISKFIKALNENKRDYALVCFMLDTGVRPGEVISLMLKDIDFTHLTAKVNGKTGSRQVYFSNATRRAMLAYLIKREKKNFTDPHFFLSEKGDPLNLDSLRLIFRRANQKADTHIYPYLLRHISATLRLKAGMNLEALRILMGHTNIKTTEVYLNLAEKDIQTEAFSTSPVEKIKKRSF